MIFTGGIMRISKKIIWMCLLFIIPVFSHAATIISPTQDETVYAGSTITVVVKPDPGEQWQGFVIGFKAFEYDPVNNSYKISIQVPNDVLGYRDDLRVLGVDTSNKEIELSRRVFVKIQPGVVLQSLSVFDQDHFLLYKLPAGSTPEDMQRVESDQLKVSGIYSDGIKRNITASVSGTTYVSSNEKVVTVSPEGKVTAQGLGNAKITVKNSKLSAKVDIVVKTYRQQQK